MITKTVPRLVVTAEQWETLRYIRNMCVGSFTGNNSVITQQQQVDYALDAQSNPRLRHYLYYAGERPVGFSRMSTSSESVTLTFGVLPNERRKGLGTEVYRLAMLAAGGPLYAHVLDDNEASIRIHQKLGWTEKTFGPEDFHPIGFRVFTCAWPPEFS